MCKLRIKGHYFNVSILNGNSPHLSGADDEAIMIRMERDDEIIIGNLNSQVSQEEQFRPIIEKFSAQ